MSKLHIFNGKRWVEIAKNPDLSLIVESVLNQLPPPIHGKDGSPDDPKAIRQKLESLVEDDRLPATAIKGLPSFDDILKQLEKLDTGVKNRVFGGKNSNFLSREGKIDQRWGGGGASTFLDLSDTPDSYAGEASKGVRVKATEDGLEFYTLVDTDEKVKASATDTTAGFLSDKLTASDTIDLTLQNGGGDEDYLIEVIYQMSIDADGSGLKLVNDEASPGNREYYGTDNSGTKGWYPLPEYDLDNITAGITNLSSSFGEHAIIGDASGGAITVNLPTASGNTAKFHIKKIDSSLDTITVNPDGSDTIDGLSSLTIPYQYDSFTLVCDGASAWYII